MGRRVAAMAVLSLLPLSTSASAAAQAGAAPVEEHPSGPLAAPYLAPDHWVMDALRRLDALGLLGGAYDPALPGIDRVVAVRLLERAGREAELGRRDLVPAVEDYRARFAAQYPVAAGGAGQRGSRLQAGGGELSAGYTHNDAELLTSVGTPPIPKRPWIPDQPAALAAPQRDAVVAGEVSGYWGRHVAGAVGAALEGGEARLGETQLVGAVGPVHAWAGRRRMRIGHGDGGIIVSGAIPMDGAGIASEPFRLPWALAHIGDIRIATALGQLERTEPYEDPWLWLFRAAVVPHPRVTLGLNRAAIAVKVDGGFGDRLRQIAYIAIGKHGATPDDNMRDNQMASVDLRYRPPLGSLPLSLYLEWGLDDSAGSWKNVPGIVGGAYLGAIPGAPSLAAGIERAHFAERCCGNIWWYRHSGFTGGWSDERRPLGHPLGGHGDEWAGRVDATLMDAAVLVKARGYLRDRGDENLFAPTFQGESRGGSITVLAAPERPPLLNRVEMGGRVEWEDGDEWSRLKAGLWLTLRL
jgi:hypothetical protein